MPTMKEMQTLEAFSKGQKNHTPNRLAKPSQLMALQKRINSKFNHPFALQKEG